MEVSGIDELRQRYVDDIIVETRALLRDDKPFAIKLRQMRPIAYMALGRGIPIPKESNGDSADGDDGDERYEYMKKVVARSVVAIREVARDGDGPWKERWREVEVVCERPPHPGGVEIPVEAIDFLNNITLCWNALFANISAGGRLAGTEAASFRPAGNGDARADGEDVLEMAPRARARKERRAGV